MSVTGERDDLPGGGPQKAGVAITDLMTGMYAAVAILAALAHRDRTGQGQWLDLALFDSAVAMMAVMGMNHLVSGTPPGRAGNAHQNIVPYQVFACADGHLILAVGNDSQFAKFCEVAGHAEWARDERFARNENRVRHRAVLVPLIAAVMRDAHAARLARRAGSRRRAVRADQQARRRYSPTRNSLARGMQFDLPHRAGGQRSAGQHAGKDVGDAARARAAAAAAGRAYARRCCASASPWTMQRSRASPPRASSACGSHDRPHVPTLRAGPHSGSPTPCLAALCLALAWRLFPLAIPLVNLDITMARHEAVAKAQALAQMHEARRRRRAHGRALSQ